MQPSKPLIAQGWLRAVVFCIVFIGLALLLTAIATLLISPPSPNNRGKEMGGIKVGLWISVGMNLLVSFTSVWLCRRFMDRQSFASLGFAWKGYHRHALTGAFAAIAMIGIATIVLTTLNYLQFTQWNVQPLTLISSAVLMILVAFYEEFVFRGYLLDNLMQSTNKWVALFVTAVLFGVLHLGNPGAGILPVIEVFIAGLMLGINYIYTRNLWFGIFLHFAWNFFQGPVFGYEVSGIDIPSAMQQNVVGPTWLTGGAFGLEGSVLAMVLNLLLIGVLVTTYNRHESTISNKFLPN